VKLTEAIGEARIFADEKLPGDLSPLANETLDVVEAHAGSLGDRGKDVAQSILARYSLGDREGARLIFLARSATFTERRQASAEMTTAVKADTEERKEVWELLERDLAKLGTIVVRYGLMALAAVV
jgi:hypothetical protein